jgi:hypothetical protein
MRAFVKLRQMLASHVDLARKLEALERKYDKQFKVVFEAIRQLMIPPAWAKPLPEIETPPQGRRRADDTLIGGVNAAKIIYGSQPVKDVKDNRCNA